jgi:3-oxoacyl-[acyl-carrier protein] reductase
MKNYFFNKHALICGSTDGIGKESAIQLAKNGCEVTLISRNEKKLIKTLGELSTKEKQNHSFLVADFNESLLLEKKICNYVQNLNKPIHILVNNSGGPKGGSLLGAGLDEFRQTFERLLIANQIMAQAVAPIMKKNHYGRIINIISTSVKQVIPGLGVSNTIRGSVAQWAKTLAMELGPFGISVNNILPGYTTTKRLKEIATNKADELNITSEEVMKVWEENTTLKRLGTPSEIANVITFLSSEKSSYITGQNISVDGGRLGV